MQHKPVLDALFEYATEGILVTNKLGELVRVNPSAERLFGYERGELIGQKIEVLIPSRYAASHQHQRDHYLHAPKNRAMGAGIELLGKRKDDTEFPVEISLSPYQFDGDTFVIGFIIDISERKKAEEKIKNHSIELEKQVNDRTLILQEAINELENTKDDLKKALLAERDLNDMKSRFVSMASHEFRTPLATILSSLALVGKYIENNDEEKRGKHMLRIKSAVANMTDILNDFLSLSKLEEGKISCEPENFEIKSFVDNIVHEMTSVAKPGQQLVYCHSGRTSEPLVRLDKKLTKGILVNLISNAIKFSEEERSIQIDTVLSDNELVIAVKDSGIGISREDQAHLFERFFRAQNAFNIHGTGLGLNIISKYAELMQGTIEVESELNVGSTFKVIFPVKFPIY